MKSYPEVLNPSSMLLLLDCYNWFLVFLIVLISALLLDYEGIVYVSTFFSSLYCIHSFKHTDLEKCLAESSYDKGNKHLRSFNEMYGESITIMFNFYMKIFYELLTVFTEKIQLLRHLLQRLCSLVFLEWVYLQVPFLFDITFQRDCWDP